MLCKQCQEQIEMGEAHETDMVEGRIRYFHGGCHRRFIEEAKHEDEEFERIAQQARVVC